MAAQKGQAQGQPNKLSRVWITSSHFFLPSSLKTKVISELKRLTVRMNWSQEPGVCIMWPNTVDIILFCSAESSWDFSFSWKEPKWWPWMPSGRVCGFIRWFTSEVPRSEGPCTSPNILQRRIHLWSWSLSMGWLCGPFGQDSPVFKAAGGAGDISGGGAWDLCLSLATILLLPPPANVAPLDLPASALSIRHLTLPQPLAGGAPSAWILADSNLSPCLELGKGRAHLHSPACTGSRKTTQLNWAGSHSLGLPLGAELAPAQPLLCAVGRMGQTKGSRVIQYMKGKRNRTQGASYLPPKMWPSENPWAEKCWAGTRLAPGGGPRLWEEVHLSGGTLGLSSTCRGGQKQMIYMSPQSSGTAGHHAWS